MTDDIPTPYDNPRTLWERLVYPLAAVAYRGGAEDASDLGTSAMQLGINDSNRLLQIVRFYHGAFPLLQGEIDRHNQRIEKIMNGANL